MSWIGYVAGWVCLGINVQSRYPARAKRKMRVWENAFAGLGQHTSTPGVTAIVGVATFFTMLLMLLMALQLESRVLSYLPSP
jgi:uncharacterized membrane protein